ncbi:SDR family NAD(P)-dependent oxidoreductase [Sphingomonas sp. BIUV-7]|uniref:SDR family NAD(P)-dependent oxidoreductase n=1 Tax=Sphingomonas natans TaxID=3063330 RepID=A0ABT8YAV5_9SPHN|nr:SDR family NAD(P)-dependent oxidoreductase [Sphingomonas sp. BIUV-7]MDO6415471.1 SDR family NAD(P)-dependent oxidoreductase [Sphingomonas sp. BIUV-7]
MSSGANDASPCILIVGASRGLGCAMAAEFGARRGWRVIGTVRGGARTPLHDLADAHAGRIEIETLDMDEAEQIAALRDRLAGRVIDLLFVNAGTTTQDPVAAVGAVAKDDFVRVMLTNALAPMRVIEALQDLVAKDGLIGAMSSGQGSIANNETGLRDVYRASKAALNMLMRSFAARQAGTGRAMVLMAPGWIRTDLGGDGAPYTIAESVPAIVDVLIAQRGAPGLRYLDRFGRTVPW